MKRGISPKKWIKQMEVGKMRVLLTGGQTQVRSTLRWLLEHDPELYVVGEAAEAQGLLAQAQKTQPDLILLDWELPGLQMTDLLPGLRALCDHPKVIVLSKRKEARREALAAGANAFVSKEEPLNWLVNTLRTVGGLSLCFVG
jgi:two-component system response regulator DesR